MDMVLALFPTRDKLEAFLGWLKAQEIDKEDKQRILAMWCDRLDIKVTGDMYKKAGIE